MTFIPPGEEKVVRPCRLHPHIRAVVDVHNLRRDEHLELCSGCFAHWLGRVSLDFGLMNELAEAYDRLEPFASEIAAEDAARERDRAEAGT